VQRASLLLLTALAVTHASGCATPMVPVHPSVQLLSAREAAPLRDAPLRFSLERTRVKVRAPQLPEATASDWKREVRDHAVQTLNAAAGAPHAGREVASRIDFAHEFLDEGGESMRIVVRTKLPDDRIVRTVSSWRWLPGEVLPRATWGLGCAGCAGLVCALPFAALFLTPVLSAAGVGALAGISCCLMPPMAAIGTGAMWLIGGPGRRAEERRTYYSDQLMSVLVRHAARVRTTWTARERGPPSMLAEMSH
jgi:hypothetical protein